MIKNCSAVQTRKSIYFAFVAAIFLLSVCLLFMLMLHDRLRQKEALDAAERYRTFEIQTERLVYSNVLLLQGFEAYLSAYPDLDEDHVYQYLHYLLKDNLDYIRNIGIMQDTTMLWNYPRATNALAIGVDLAKIDAQREQVLKVKEELRPVFHGPIDLVQGGSGFSVRLPIIRGDTGYWGQASIVLKTDEILAEIRSYAEEANLDIAIFTGNPEDPPILGTIHAPQNALLEFNMDPTFINWKVYINLSDSWGRNPLLPVLLFLLSLGLSAAVGIFTCKYLKNNYKILNMSTHDSLTGLYNRHFLHDYQAVVLSGAERARRGAAILMLDLDYFKEINDTYGHSVGDRVLAETARILETLTRAGEVVFRLGGDEFLIMLPEVDSMESLPDIRARLSRGFEELFAVRGYPAIKVTFSLGYALFPEDGENIDALLRAADKRLYQEKLEKKKRSDIS